MNPQKNTNQRKNAVVSWAGEIIKKYKLGSTSSFDEIVKSLIDFYYQKFPHFKIVRTFNEEAPSLFYVKERDEDEPDTIEDYLELDVFDLALGLEPDTSKPMTAACKEIAENLMATFTTLLVDLKIVDQEGISLFLKEIKKGPTNENPFETLTPTVINWARRIISCFKITSETPMDIIERRVLFFLDMLYEDYSISYSNKNRKQFPVNIKKHFNDGPSYADNLSAFRQLVYSTCYRVLEILGRTSEYSAKPSEYWW
ncbi:MAG: hypothetical protein K9W42_06260 [Candidatus Heimdallarchaeota archaeon]|nr:hypothetical protein [Candidatus Heimdallarchaeota archaeon]